MGEARYNIGQLAKAAGVAATTVRFYERKGLILPVGRTLSNYRWYDDRSLARLRLIRQAHAGGFSLGDISAMLDSSADSPTQCRKVSQLIAHRLAKVRSQLKELRRLEAALAADLKRCSRGSRRSCAVLEHLRDQTASRALGTIAVSKS